MHQSVSYQYLVQRRRLHQEASLPVFWGENMSWPPWLLALKVHPNGTWREPERNLNPIPLIFTRRRETRVWTMEWECFISGGWDCWGVNMLLSWGFGLPMPLWVTTHPHINSFCWCLAWLLGSSGFQIPKPIQHDSPKLVHVMSSAAENRRISPMYSANINFLGAVDYYWTTKLYQIVMFEAQNQENGVWTKYVNPEIQLKSTHGRWSRWWSGQCSQCRSRSPNYFRPCTMPYRTMPYHATFSTSGFPLSCNLTIFVNLDVSAPIVGIVVACSCRNTLYRALIGGGPFWGIVGFGCQNWSVPSGELT